MQQVVKVNIGGVAFTLEREAYDTFQQYLSSLEEYYLSNNNGGEIISGIEERVAELLVDSGYSEQVVPLREIERIISILGSPEDLGGGTVRKNKIKKRVFRDVEHKTIAGVCSGLGAYLNVDPIWFKLIFSVSTLFLLFSECEFFLFIPLLYLLLWITMPAARTTEQRCQMRGESNSIEDIQKRVESGARRATGAVKRASSGLGRGLGRAVSVAIGVFLLLIGMFGAVLNILFFLGSALFDNILPLDFSYIYSLVFNGPVWMGVLLQISVILLTTIPCIAMIYAGVMILFKLKSPRWRPAMVMLVIWIVALVTNIATGIGSLSYMGVGECKSVTQPISEVRDTIYVEYVDSQKWKDEKVLLSASRGDFNLVYFIEKPDERYVAYYPEFDLIRRGVEENPRLVSEMVSLSRATTLGDLQKRQEERYDTFTGDTVRLVPTIFGKGEDPSFFCKSVRLYVPGDVTVIVREPVYHQFEGSFEFSNMRFPWIFKMID